MGDGGCWVGVVGRPVAADGSAGPLCPDFMEFFTIGLGGIKHVEARIVIIGNEAMRLIPNPCLVVVVILI